MAHDRAAGAGLVPSHGSIPAPGAKPDGALFKRPTDIAPGPNVTKPPAPGTPGTTDPASPRNRDMSLLILPTVPAPAAAARA